MNSVFDYSQMKRPTNKEVVTNFSLWQDYVDPIGVDTQDWFETASTKEKLEILRQCFEPNNEVLSQ